MLLSSASAQQSFEPSKQDANIKPVSQDMVDEIKSMTNAWTPLEVDENPFKDMSLDELRDTKLGGLGGEDGDIPGMLKADKHSLDDGLFSAFGDFLNFTPSSRNLKEKPTVKAKKFIRGDDRLPRNYNVRERYPQCSPRIFNQ